MTAAKAPEKEILKIVEAAFGYPLADPAVRDYLLGGWAEELEDTALVEVFGDFIARSVNWTAEGHPGRRPDEEAREAQFARIKRPLPKEPIEPEPPEVVARHLAGLLSIDVNYVKHVEEHWLVDLAPGAKRGVSAPVYKWKPAGHPEGAVFESAAALAAWKKAVDKLESAEADENETAMRRIGTELRQKFPRAFALEFERLLKDNLLVPELRKPVPDDKFTDEAGERIWSGYRALLPVGRVLVARADGDKSARLSAAEAKVCAAVADTGGDSPPAILMRLFCPALSGAVKEAMMYAKEVAKKELGVPLTQRWASLILEQKGPFGP
jgi:hypothetical protein